MASTIASRSCKRLKLSFGLLFLLLVSVNISSNVDFPSQLFQSSVSSLPINQIRNHNFRPSLFDLSSSSTVSTNEKVQNKPLTVQRPTLRQDTSTQCQCSQDTNVQRGTCYDYIDMGPECNPRECGYPWVCDSMGMRMCELKTVTKKIVPDGHASCSTIITSFSVLYPL